jgi:hypothetical protein
MNIKNIALGTLSSLIFSGIAHSELYSPVTFTGTLTWVDVYSQTPRVTRLYKEKVSNSSLLYTLYDQALIATTKGYQVVEIFANNGDSLGIYALNLKLQHLVKFDDISLNDLFNGQVVAPNDATSRKPATDTYSGYSTGYVFQFDGYLNWTGVASYNNPLKITNTRRFFGCDANGTVTADITAKTTGSKLLPFLING